jgi:class 3 adenylate cyclase
MRDSHHYIQDFIPQFRHPQIEFNFQRFHYEQNEILTQSSFLLYIFIQMVLIMTEFTNHNLYHTDLIIICSRVIIIMITLIGWWFCSERYQSYRRFVILLTLNLISFMLIALSTLVTSQYQHHHQLQDSNYLFSWGPWSLSDSYLFLVICFNCSGLLFADATNTSAIHIFLVLIFPFLFFFNRHPSSIPAPLRLICLPVLHVIEMVFIQRIEYENRDRYIGQIERGYLLLSQDKLISSILPSHISEALKVCEQRKRKIMSPAAISADASAEEEEPSPLAAYYEDVTIMFCSIVDFSSQSSLIHPHDTINLSLHLISAMDRIVEQTGAYKVENIGDTFMACAGCPKEVPSSPSSCFPSSLSLSYLLLLLTRRRTMPSSSAGPPLLSYKPQRFLSHLLRSSLSSPSVTSLLQTPTGGPVEVARWLLSLLEDRHPHRSSLPFSFLPPSLAPLILLLGAVTGGIVGTKSYSYHLFGDAVNTASRMCSHSSPGKILLSSTAELAMRSNHPGPPILLSSLATSSHSRRDLFVA